MCGTDNTSNPHQEEEIPLDDLEEKPTTEKTPPIYYENDDNYKSFDTA